MSRFDKYDPIAGGFRGKLKLAFVVTGATPAITAVNKERLFGVSIEAATGLVLIGGAVGAVRGIVNIREDHAAGDMVDVMSSGEVINFNFLNDGTTPTVLGTPYHADAATGAPTATAASNKGIGFLIADSVSGRNRLIVRCIQGA
jgi:hypothetical protein